ncbi:hypothetical protein Droror1_Dr00017938 [Drosera rotundifolia]
MLVAGKLIRCRREARRGWNQRAWLPDTPQSNAWEDVGCKRELEVRTRWEVVDVSLSELHHVGFPQQHILGLPSVEEFSLVHGKEFPLLTAHARHFGLEAIHTITHVCWSLQATWHGSILLHRVMLLVFLLRSLFVLTRSPSSLDAHVESNLGVLTMMLASLVTTSSLDAQYDDEFWVDDP